MNLDCTQILSKYLSVYRCTARSSEREESIEMVQCFFLAMDDQKHSLIRMFYV